MTTKYKIITGFSFVMLLLLGLSIFSHQSLNSVSLNFNKYRVGARTGVNGNAAVARLHEARDLLTNFLLTLNPALVDDARARLTDSVKYLTITADIETNPEHKRQLSGLAEQVGKMNELTKIMQERFLLANRIVSEKLVPSANMINDALSRITAAAVAHNNMAVVSLVDSAYTSFMDLRLRVATYNATYLPEDGILSHKLLGEFDEIQKKIGATAVAEETRKAHQTMAQGLQSYAAAFKDLDSAVKEAIQARQQVTDIARAASTYLAKYAEDTLAAMNNLGGAIHESNDNTQRLLIVGAVLGIALGLASAVWIILGVIRVLTQVSTFASEIARGVFDAKLSVKEGGEIGSMAASIRAIPETLSKMAAEYARIEERVEHGEIDVQGDTAAFSGGFATLIEGTNNILKRFSMILNNIPSPMMLLGADLKAAYLNKAGRDLVGAGYKGKSCGELFRREDDKTPTCALTLALKTGEIHSAETVAHPGGKRLDIRYTAVPMKDAKGTLASIMQFIVDLTHSKETERMIIDVANQAHENAERVAAASEELSAQVEEVSRGADMQRARVESTATAMNEMNATVLEVARNAGNASEQSEETRKKANDGAELVNKVVKAINGVNTVALSLQENMKGLGGQAESIGGVMNVISDIADQTNLLALNAAIEAARAGEAGRGFAVVADEVRKLAEKTMSATQEVGSNIQAIQNSTRTNISEVTNAVKSIGEATDLANASGQALGEIVKLAVANSAVVSSIATAAEEQSATSEEINSALEDVNRVVSETAQGMTQASSAVHDLSEVAQRLKGLIERLRRS